MLKNESNQEIEPFDYVESYIILSKLWEKRGYDWLTDGYIFVKDKVIIGESKNDRGKFTWDECI